MAEGGREEKRKGKMREKGRETVFWGFGGLLWRMKIS